MSERDQARALSADLGKLIRHYRDEFEIPYCVAIGVLETHKHWLCSELMAAADAAAESEETEEED
jgi:hypothetical protein